MSRCVGKPTLHQIVSEPFREVVAVNFLSRRKIDDRPGQAESVSGASHRRQRLLTRFGVASGRGGERPDPPSLGESQSGVDDLDIGMAARRLAVLVADSCNMQRLNHSALAEAPACKRPRLGQRVGGVIDVTERDETFRESLKIRRVGPGPPPFADLSC